MAISLRAYSRYTFLRDRQGQPMDGGRQPCIEAPMQSKSEIEEEYFMGVPAAIGDIWTRFVATRDPALRDELITAYAPLVRFVVSRLGIPPSCLLDADDLLSCGTIGLINAIDQADRATAKQIVRVEQTRRRNAQAADHEANQGSIGSDKLVAQRGIARGNETCPDVADGRWYTHKIFLLY